jgi:hypothetical protein
MKNKILFPNNSRGWEVQDQGAVTFGVAEGFVGFSAFKMLP